MALSIQKGHPRTDSVANNEGNNETQAQPMKANQRLEPNDE
ncbi:hypothetical protein [Paratractidigestivibacter sp.]